MEDRLIITPIPSLVATLLDKEREKGSALTREEVETIRDEAPARALTYEQRAAVDERRGYDDIDPDRVWEDWTIVRIDLNGDG